MLAQSLSDEEATSSVALIRFFKPIVTKPKADDESEEEFSDDDDGFDSDGYNGSGGGYGGDSSDEQRGKP